MKTCPFCGGNGRVSSRQLRFIGQHDIIGTRVVKMASQVICNRCHARGPVVTETITDPYYSGNKYLKENEETAIAFWNSFYMSRKE